MGRSIDSQVRQTLLKNPSYATEVVKKMKCLWWLILPNPLITKAMLSSGEKNAEATLLSLMWQSVSL